MAKICFELNDDVAQKLREHVIKVMGANRKQSEYLALLVTAELDRVASIDKMAQE